MYCNIVATILFVTASLNVNAGVIINDTATFEFGYDFEGPQDRYLTSAQDNEGYFIGELSYDTITFGESFKGQTISDDGIFESLSTLNASSLELQTNDIAKDNIAVVFTDNAGQAGVYGGNDNMPGTGSIAMLFNDTTDIFQFMLFDGNFGEFSINFYNDSAKLLGSFTQTASDYTLFGYKVESGDRIAGVTITNKDQGGMGIGFVYEEKIARISEPQTVILFFLSLLMIFQFTRKSR